jgi:hypothetical protein
MSGRTSSHILLLGLQISLPMNTLLRLMVELYYVRFHKRPLRRRKSQRRRKNLRRRKKSLKLKVKKVKKKHQRRRRLIL